MYEFPYKYIKRGFNAKLLFTDTGSLVYKIETDDVYEDFYKNYKIQWNCIQSFLILPKRRLLVK